MGPYFVFFMGVWAYLRHWVNLRILWSILTEFKTVGPYELNWETQQYKCWIAQYITFTLLAAIQGLNLIWWFYICRIAYRFAVTQVAEDERSEYEESEGESESNKKTEKSKKNTKSNGTVASNGTPKVLINGEALTPDHPLNGEEPGSIGSRLRERKTKK